MPHVKLPTLEVAVVIPVKGKFEDLAITLDSLDKLNSDFADTVVVVDGHQKEIIDGLDKKKFKNIEPTTILNDNTRGSYYSRNRGYKHTSAAYVWFIDSGVEVLRDCKAALKSVIDLELDYSGGAIELAYPQSREVEIIDILTKLTEFKVKRCLQYRHFAPTANLLVKRSILDQVKGFNSTLYSGGDQEFGYRVWKAGFSQHYIKQLKVSHQTRSKEELYLKSMSFKTVEKPYSLPPVSAIEY
ncbi:MAG: glycosyltransferase family 2 protein [Cyanothece sp. SIO1E1]|nr:glycosyltransferase family 2 protein [Cyanothece sp. SIO1E1]